MMPHLLNLKTILLSVLFCFYLQINSVNCAPRCSQSSQNKEIIVCTDVADTQDLHNFGLQDWKAIKIVSSEDTKQLEWNEIPLELRNVEVIDVSQAGSLILTENAFVNLSNLKTLNVSYCGIESLEKSSLNAAKKLENLDASWNMLTNLNFDTNKLRSLEIANFSNNQIQAIISSGAVQKLRILHLDFNELKNVSLQSYNNLNVLTLSNNLIEQLTSTSFQNLPAMQELILSSNYLTQIEDRSFASMTDLKNLNISENSIAKLSSQVFAGLSRLIQLDLNSNNIIELANFQFQYLTKLQYLDISRNSLSTLNSSHFHNLVSLRKLFLQENDIKEINGNTFANLNSLDTLDLSNNNIESLDANVFGAETLPRLRKLLLKSNSLKSLHPLAFASLPFLQYLSMGMNELTSLDVRMFAPMRRLEKLHLGNNLLETIPAEVLESLTDVTELLLDRNRLSFLSNSNATFSKLERVSLEGNPWQCPCWDEMAKWLEARGVSYIRINSPYFRGQKPLCVVTPVNFCVKNLRLVKEHKIEEIYNSG